MMSASRKWRDVLPIHPAAELFPLMSPDELRALGEDIRKNGLREQVKVISTWSKPLNGFDPAIELTNVLIDGRNRLDAMEAAGISLFRMDGQLEDSHFRAISAKIIDPYAYVVSANIHRRHLTAEQKREVIAKLIKAAPEKSNRQIADQVKVSHPMVAAVRADLETKGDVVKVSTSIDTKGRKQPAHRKPEKKAKPRISAVEPARVSPTAQDDSEPPAALTLQDHVDSIADQIMHVAESLVASDRASFFDALRHELDTIERLLPDAPEAAKSAVALG